MLTLKSKWLGIEDCRLQALGALFGKTMIGAAFSEQCLIRRSGGGGFGKESDTSL